MNNKETKIMKAIDKLKELLQKANDMMFTGESYNESESYVSIIIAIENEIKRLEENENI